MQARDSDIKCDKNNHIKTTDLVCVKCNRLVCARCFKEHSSHSAKIVEIDEVMEEAYLSAELVPEKIETYRQRLHAQSKKAQEQFESQIKTQYEQEVDNITNYFRKIHDQFHSREVSVKSNLADYNEKNLATYANYKEQADLDIKDANELKNFFLDMPFVPKQVYPKETKVDLIKKFIRANKILDTLKTDKEEEEKQKKFNQLVASSGKANYNFQNDKRYHQYILHEPFTSVEFINSSMEIINSEKLFQSVFIYGDAFQKINLGRKTVENIDIIGDKFDQSRSIFKSMVCTNDKIYIFRRKEFLLYDPKENTWAVKPLGTFNRDCGDWISAQYDGAKGIYLFGGCNGANNHRNIHKFNIDTHVLDLNIAQTRIPIRFQTTCHVNENELYTIDGVQQSYEKESILEKFDTQTKTLTIVKDFGALGHADIVAMCYVSNCDSIFLYCQNQSLIQYNLKTNEVDIKASKSFGSVQCYVLLQYDGKNTIYCVTKNDCAQYNIATDTWTKINVGVLHPFELHEYAMCWTDKF